MDVRNIVLDARRIAGRGLLWAAAAFVTYLAAGLIGGAIPTNLAWRETPDGIRIHVEDNGIHTGIVLPVAAAGVDWRDLIRPQDLRDPRYAGHQWLSFGWGDRGFYVGTPTWADVRPGPVLRAATGSDDTVMHVGFLPDPEGADRVRSFTVSVEEYRRLAAHIRASFAVGANGRAPHVAGYGAADAFYAAHGRYSMFRTCNVWTGDTLRQAGIRTGLWTPFAVGVMAWL